MGPRRTRRRTVAVLAAASALALAACSPLQSDVQILASDALGGRENATEGSVLAQQYIIDRLDDFAVGFDPTQRGDDAFRQVFDGGVGTNILALIPGDDLADEYLIVGAHYDHLGTFCPTADPADMICNGATDNATGVAAVLAIGERLARQRGGPRRSVILALWDREESAGEEEGEGLVGSRYYVAHPVVPLAQTVGYLNFDIQGANILPSLRTTTFAVAAETGGDRLASALDEAVDPGPLETHALSATFGQGRSDYQSFVDAGVPAVFFTDATGPCYHTAQDDVDAVDFWKLRHEVRDAHRLADDLADGDETPVFVSPTSLATYADAVALRMVVNRARADFDRFSPEEQAQLIAYAAALTEIVAAGPAAFGPDDIVVLLSGAEDMFDIFASGECDSFTRS
jgi:Peptidase family M28